MQRRSPHGMGQVAPEKARNFWPAIRQLLDYLGRYKLSLVGVVILALASTLFSIMGPWLLGMATTELYDGALAQLAGSGAINFAAISRLLLQALGLYLTSAAFAYIMGWVMSAISADISYRLRRDISDKIHRLPLKYFDKITHGEVLSRITNDVEAVNQTLSQSLTQIITSLVTVVGVLGMMLVISWQMTLAALIIVPLSLVSIIVIASRSQKYFVQQLDFISKVNGHVEEMFGGHLVMKAFNGEADSVAEFERRNDALHEVAWKSQFFSGLMIPVLTVVGSLGYVIVAIVGAWMFVQGRVPVGSIQAFIQYVSMLNQPLAQLANVTNVSQMTAAAAERIFDFLAEAEETPDTPTPQQITQPRGEVEFRNVSFGYEADQPVIRNLSALVKPGQKVAIVGPTGAGKTTVVKLLMRFYDVNAGEILVDGQDIRQYTRQDLRRNFAMVLQDTWLYSGSIMDNIRYGVPGASDEDVIAAAKAAYADHFINTLPDGYKMVINEEISNISQGQMQLLTIARAVLADAPILILDEATSSVDTRTELLIQAAMDRLMEGRTSFVIAHRLSTIRNADNIFVMRDGDIVEQGNHAALLAAGGFYAELYNSQFERDSETAA
ncbi:MAG: ABC transporter ATP-binding protein [Anaerolineales bacterium]|nr:ABC transporter ATP-binding protein [Anaerolineales bacterium]MCW5854787.1 ABC transporter ATP-binding protein [Anaerolineales bacterium]